MYPYYLPLLLSAFRRLAWSIFGASVATAFFAMHASHAPAPAPIASQAAPALTVQVPDVHVHVDAPKAAANEPATSPSPRSLRVLSEMDEHACSRAWAEGGVHRSPFGITYMTRNFLDKTLEQQAELMHSARIVPEMEHGRTVGVKIFGLRPESALTRLGFLTGDSLRAIDGYDLTSPETALEAYSRLRNSSDYHVEIARFGRPKMLLFRVC